MAQFLFFNVIIRENRLNQKGLLKRFSLDCYLLYDGTQKTIEEEKIKKLYELKGNRKFKEFDRSRFTNYLSFTNKKKSPYQREGKIVEPSDL